MRRFFFSFLFYFFQFFPAGPQISLFFFYFEKNSHTCDDASRYLFGLPNLLK